MINNRWEVKLNNSVQFQIWYGAEFQKLYQCLIYIVETP